MKHILAILLILATGTVYAQDQITEASVGATGLISTGNNLPFWMTHNQSGKYATSGNIQTLTEGKLSGIIYQGNNLHIRYGADLALLTSENGVDPQVIEAYAEVIGKILTLKGGAFADEEILGGLSSTNGDLVRSLNHRPYPMARLSTSGFIPFLFAKNWFRFRAEYDEGLLPDERIVENPRLHHKSLMLRFLATSTCRVTVGMNHYVFWGGHSAQYGDLPHSLNDYFHYITGSKGSSNFLMTDQINVAGNQLGSYLLTIEKDFNQYQIEFRASHPFEDRSGMEFDNLKDNLYALYFRQKKTGRLIDEVLFEYIYTKHQSGSHHLSPDPAVKHNRGLDNYFNHGIYQSGFTYKTYSLGTPLFEPIRYAGKQVSGVANNRISAFHLGASGYFSPRLQWKGLLTCSRNFGTYAQPYTPFKKQLYSIGELRWRLKNYPLSFSGLLAADAGQMSKDQIGLGLGIHWIIR